MPSPSRISPALTIAQVADRWQIARNTVYEMVSSGILPAMRFGAKGGSLRIRPEDVEAYELQCLNTGSYVRPSTESEALSGMQSGEKMGAVTERRVASATRGALKNG